MTPVVLLILAIVWIVVLAPGLIKKWTERHSVESIDSFHYQLHLLERTGPKLMEPAYSLHKPTASDMSRTVGGDGLSTDDRDVDQRSLQRTTLSGGGGNLVLLRPLDEHDVGEFDDAKVVDDEHGGRYARVGLCAVPDSNTNSVGRPDPEAFRRRRIRKRRRDLLLGIVATFFFTGALGFVHSLRVLWVLTALSAIALVAYVGLAAYAQSIEEASHARQAHGRNRSRSASLERERQRPISSEYDEDQIYYEDEFDRQTIERRVASR